MHCSFIKDDEQRCQAKCLKGGRFCFFHDPKTREAHREAATLGAKARNKSAVTPPATLPPDTPDSSLASNHDVRAFVADTLNKLRTGKLAVNVSLAIFQGAGILLKAIDSSIIEDRITALEQKRTSN